MRKNLKMNDEVIICVKKVSQSKANNKLNNIIKKGNIANEAAHKQIKKISLHT